MLVLILGAVLMLGVCIFVHELGHLLCGLMVGVKARIFSIGYGRGVWKKRVGGTLFQITKIPIGGYVMFRGDEYGKQKGKQGELLSVHPIKRMLPVLGGPLFNLIMGFLIFAILAFVGDDQPGNKIFIDKSIRDYSAAYEAGLRSGDRIISINSKPTESFEDIFTEVSLSAGEKLEIEYKRDETIKSATIVPNIYAAGGRPSIGVMPAGKRNIEVNFTYGEQFRAWLADLLGELHKPIPEKYGTKPREQQFEAKAIHYLKDGDVILKVENTPISTVPELQELLGKYQGEKVKIEVERKLYSLLTPWLTKKETVQVPVTEAYILEFYNMRDSEFDEFNVETYSFASYDPNLPVKLSNIKINGKSFSEFKDLIEFLRKIPDKPINLVIGNLRYKSQYKIKPIGLLGFRPSMKFQADPIEKKVGFFESFVIAGEKVYQIVSTTLKGLGMIFSGLISPRDSLSGPVGIIQFAGLSLEYGWLTYLDFVAKISIALMIMNLLPIPVADGFYIVLYFYEAIAGRPLPSNVINFVLRIGFVLLLLLGLLVTFNDISRFFR